MKFGLGSLKGKIIAGTLVVGVVSGSSFAFANTDAGENLRAWYDDMFGQSVDTIEADTEAYMDDQVPGLIDEYEALKDEAGVDIDLTRETATGESLDEIVAAKLSHIEAIDEEKAEILAGMQLQYYNVMLDGFFEIETVTGEWLNYATNDLTAFTGDTGEAALNEMTTDINTASDDAVQELEAAIQNAQDELAAAIESNETVTIDNLRSQVDWAIEDLRDEVEALLAGLVEEQQNIIIAAAEDLEEDAINALDDVVSGINE
ncbi:hypothetical protein ACDX78_17330 [Virgibacillus oceani]